MSMVFLQKPEHLKTNKGLEYAPGVFPSKIYTASPLKLKVLTSDSHVFRLAAKL